MRERDIHKLIEQQNPEEKQRVWEKVCAKLNIPVTPLTEQRPSRKKKAWLWSTFAMVMVCVVTLAVVLPLTLKKEEEPKIRYCDATQYVVEPLNQTLKEYSFSHNKSLLYIDWYSNAEELKNEYAHANNDVNDIIFIREELLNGATGEVLSFSVTNNKTRVDIFESFITEYQVLTVKNTAVKYKISNFTNCSATFEYDGYIYYIQLITDGGAARLTEVIGEMIK